MSLSNYFDSGIVKLHRPNELMSMQLRDYDNVLVVYHAQCVDGFTAAMVCWSATSGRATLIPAEYQRPIIWPTVTGRTWILFVDFCPDIKTMDELCSIYERVTLIDHHVGQQREAKLAARFVRAEVLFTTERSGAYLTWLFAYGSEPPAIIRAVDDYDRWVHAIPFGRAVNKFLDSLGYDPQEWAGLFEQTSDSIMQMRYDHACQTGAAMLRLHAKHVKDIEMMSTKRWIKLLVDEDGSDELWAKSFPLYNAPKWLASDLGHNLAVEHGIGGTYFINGKFCIVSLRSLPDYDVSRIAKRYGGGGHKNSAGFTVPVQVADMMFREARDIMYGESRGNGG